ncbi:MULTISPECIES: hypothetical protein [Borreliella]|uniref:Borrelial persistence in ticks protein A n=1 Tax=Borreliella afzelii TaxID=29518 RepID=A0AB34Z3Y8_BORAF|nr:hypothetical protein [Borreliella afzelii]
MIQKQIFIIFLLFVIFVLFLLLSKGTGGFSYNQSKDDGYMEKYFHKKGKTAVKLSYFHTSRIIKESPYWGKGTLSTIYTGEDEKFSGLSFINSRYIKYGKKNYYKMFTVRYFYRENENDDYGYPMLRNKYITQIKIKFSFDNEPQEIIRELNEGFINGRNMWELHKTHFYSREEFFRVHLKTSDPGIENLLPKLLKHKTITITIEVPESEDPDKQISSITFDLDGFQRLYKKYSSYFN